MILLDGKHLTIEAVVRLYVRMRTLLWTRSSYARLQQAVR